MTFSFTLFPNFLLCLSLIGCGDLIEGLTGDDDSPDDSQISSQDKNLNDLKNDPRFSERFAKFAIRDYTPIPEPRKVTGLTYSTTEADTVVSRDTTINELDDIGNITKSTIERVDIGADAQETRSFSSTTTNEYGDPNLPPRFTKSIYKYASYGSDGNVTNEKTSEITQTYFNNREADRGYFGRVKGFTQSSDGKKQYEGTSSFQSEEPSMTSLVAWFNFQTGAPEEKSQETVKYFGWIGGPIESEESTSTFDNHAGTKKRTKTAIFENNIWVGFDETGEENVPPFGATINENTKYQLTKWTETCRFNADNHLECKKEKSTTMDDQVIETVTETSKMQCEIARYAFDGVPLLAFSCRDLEASFSSVRKATSELTYSTTTTTTYDDKMRVVQEKLTTLSYIGSTADTMPVESTNTYTYVADTNAYATEETVRDGKIYSRNTYEY